MCFKCNFPAVQSMQKTYKMIMQWLQDGTTPCKFVYAKIEVFPRFGGGREAVELLSRGLQLWGAILENIAERSQKSKSRLILAQMSWRWRQRQPKNAKIRTKFGGSFWGPKNEEECKTSDGSGAPANICGAKARPFAFGALMSSRTTNMSRAKQ
ncbi:uncharacterized protein EV420DRAFT_1481236 [Desarmillaria tabescens]|uniref:Uncharacterized protein n=1 Tax=Armillaria tabescens TaxID=1929756 RepID=A0AA39K741_ARMTA|nr:uncharacterized protein EV420DRAFT_1481236 [Desarmillaria tabescens]KAK0455796.1 hypothetical protein EV420DRAFT_1481236 [Desarmillaria tabescens]